MCVIINGRKWNLICENKLSYYNFNICLFVFLLLNYKYEHIEHFKHEPQPKTAQHGQLPFVDHGQHLSNFPCSTRSSPPHAHAVMQNPPHTWDQGQNTRWEGSILTDSNSSQSHASKVSALLFLQPISCSGGRVHSPNFTRRYGLKTKPRWNMPVWTGFNRSCVWCMRLERSWVTVSRRYLI